MLAAMPLSVGAGSLAANARRGPRRQQQLVRRRPASVRASADDISAPQWAAAFTEKSWDSLGAPWSSFLAVKGKKGPSQGFMLQEYASPVQLLNNGIGLSLPSSAKDAARRVMCNTVFFRQNYVVVFGLCLLISAFPRPFELLLLASAVAAVVSTSRTLFDRLWVECNKERVFKYLPFETPRKLTGELVGGESSVCGVPRVLIQGVSLLALAFSVYKTHSGLVGLGLCALLTFIPSVLIHALLRPIDLYGGGSWTELASSVKRREVLSALGKAMAG